MSDQKKLTTNAGAPIVDNQNIMTAGPRGPALLSADVALSGRPGLRRRRGQGARHPDERGFEQRVARVFGQDG